MNENSRLDQAEGLRSRMIDDYKQEHGDYPPRSEVHKEKAIKTKLKMKYPVISLLALFFILLPIFILSMNLYFNANKEQSNKDANVIGEETVFISKGQEEEIETENTPQEEISTSANVEENEDEASREEVSETMVTTDASTIEKVEGTTENDKTVTQSEEEKISSEDYIEIKTHKVAAGETLFKIAVKYYNSRDGEEIIRKYNGIDGNNIYVGQVLEIPIK